jgi:hypothetical protein
MTRNDGNSRPGWALTHSQNAGGHLRVSRECLWDSICTVHLHCAESAVSFLYSEAGSRKRVDNAIHTDPVLTSM